MPIDPIISAASSSPVSREAKPAESRVAGIILAGGAGRRMDAPAMGVAGKPFVPLGGRPLIAHVIAQLRPQVSELFISADDPSLFAGLGLTVLPDALPGRLGPLAGVLAGLDALAASGRTDMLLSVPTDAPFLPGDLGARFLARAQETHRPVCAASLGRRHPVIALWPVEVREALRAHLERGERRVGLVLDLLGAGSLDWPATAGDPFFNVNTPEDVGIARSRLTASS